MTKTHNKVKNIARCRNNTATEMSQQNSGIFYNTFHTSQTVWNSISFKTASETIRNKSSKYEINKIKTIDEFIMLIK